MTDPTLRPFLLGLAAVVVIGILAGCATPKSACGAGHEDIARQVSEDREHLKRIRKEIAERQERQRIYDRIWDCQEAAEKGATP